MLISPFIAFFIMIGIFIGLFQSAAAYLRYRKNKREMDIKQAEHDKLLALQRADPDKYWSAVAEKNKEYLEQLQKEDA